MIVVAECKITKECLELALLMWIINASLRGGIVTVQHCGAEPFQKLVVMQFVDIDLPLIYLYREDTWNVPVSYFSLNVVSK